MSIDDNGYDDDEIDDDELDEDVDINDRIKRLNNLKNSLSRKSSSRNNLKNSFGNNLGVNNTNLDASQPVNNMNKNFQGRDRMSSGANSSNSENRIGRGANVSSSSVNKVNGEKDKSSIVDKTNHKDNVSEPQQGIVNRGVNKLTSATKTAGSKIASGVKNTASNIGSKAVGAATNLAYSNPVTGAVLTGIKMARALKSAANNLKTKISGKSAEKIKQEKKKKRRIVIFVRYILPVLILLIGAVSYGASEELVNAMDGLIKRREERYAGNLGLTRDSGVSYKPLILFTENEYYETIYKDYDKDYCYKTMLKSYGSSDGFFLDIFGSSELDEKLKDDEDFQKFQNELKEEIEKSGKSIEDDEFDVSARNALVYLKAEQNNFNNISWTSYENNYKEFQEAIVFESDEELEEGDKPFICSGSNRETLKDEQLVQVSEFGYNETGINNYVYDVNLKVPDFRNNEKFDPTPNLSVPVQNADETNDQYAERLNQFYMKKAMVYIDMLSPYMQKWVIPFAIAIDTNGDKEFLKNVTDPEGDMIHKASVSSYTLKRAIKVTTKIYTTGLTIEFDYTEGNETTRYQGVIDASSKYLTSETSLPINSGETYTPDSTGFADILGEMGLFSIWKGDMNAQYKIISVVESGETKVHTRIERSIQPYKTVQKLNHIEDLYYIYNTNYRITPINEDKAPTYTSTSKFILNSGSKKEVITEIWEENLEGGGTATTPSTGSTPGTPGKNLANAQEIYETYKEYIDKASEKYGIDPWFIVATIGRESSGNPNAINKAENNKEYVGLMQTCSDYYANGTYELHTLKGIEQMKVSPEDMYDPEVNIEMGTSIMRLNLEIEDNNLMKAMFHYSGHADYLEFLENYINAENGTKDWWAGGEYPWVIDPDTNEKVYCDWEGNILENYKPKEEDTKNVENNIATTQTVTNTLNTTTIASTNTTSVKTYKISRYAEEDYEELSRRISRIEWAQDWGDLSGKGTSYTPREYIPGKVTPPTEEHMEFLMSLVEPAIEAGKETGIYPSITIAQAIIESGWGGLNDQSPLVLENKNYFGMKYSDSKYNPIVEEVSDGYMAPESEWINNDYWDGYIVEYKASEGQMAWFRDYSHMDDPMLASLLDHNRNFWVTECYYYDGVLECIPQDLGADEQLWRISQHYGGYSPEGYHGDVWEIIDEYNLEQYDEQFLDEGGWDGTIPSYAGEWFEGERGEPGSSLKVSGSTNTIYPSKSRAKRTIAYEKYGNGKGYAYVDLEIAFSQIDRYYPDDYFKVGSNPVKVPSGYTGIILGWPVEITEDNPDTAVINGLFGITGYGTYHSGVTISCGNTELVVQENGLSKGPKVLAAHDGIVTVATAEPTSDEDDYTYVEIITSDKKYTTQYGHLSEIYVKIGDKVKKGDVIGRMGTTGNSTRVQLHFAMWNGSDRNDRVDPLDFYNLDPEYGTINRKQITGIPTGYRFKSEKTVGGYIGDHETVTTKAGTFPRYRQGSGEPWEAVPYGGGNMANWACGPTSMSIILSGWGLVIPGYDGIDLNGFSMLKDNIMEPFEVARYCEDTGNNPAGMSWAFPATVMNNFGIETIQLGAGSAQTVLEYLEQGCAGVASTSYGYFTTGGHIIAIVGTDGNGGIGVVDPANSARDGFYTVDQMNGYSAMPSAGAAGGTNSNVVQWWIFKK